MEILLLLILCVICPPLGFAVIAIVVLNQLWNLYYVWCLSGGSSNDAKPTKPSLVERMQLNHNKQPLLARVKKTAIADRIQPTINEI